VTIGFIVLLNGCAWWDRARFSLDRLAEKNPHEVINALGSPSWLSPLIHIPRSQRLDTFNDEAIQIAMNGGSANFIYHRLTLSRYCVHFTHGLVTRVTDGTK